MMGGGGDGGVDVDKVCEGVRGGGGGVNDG